MEPSDRSHWQPVATRLSGMLSLLRLAVLGPAFADEIRLASPPWPVQRAAFALMAPIARLCGYTVP